MKNLWQYKHWPDEKNPDEIEPWPADQPPNPCTVFRVKWLEQIRTWARYVSGEFVENLLTVQPPQPPDPITTDTVVQKASFWDFLTFSGEWSLRWDRFANIPEGPGAWNPTAVELPDWGKFHVGDVLHPGATEPNDVLMDQLEEYRRYIESIKAIEIHDHFLHGWHWATGGTHNPNAYGTINSDLRPFVQMIFHDSVEGTTQEDNCYISGIYWPPWFADPRPWYATCFVRGVLGQRNYRIALLSEWGKTSGVPPPPYNAWPTDALYCHELFDLISPTELTPWISVSDIGRTTGGSAEGDSERLMRYFLLIDDDLPPALAPPGAPILSPG